MLLKEAVRYLLSMPLGEHHMVIGTEGFALKVKRDGFSLGPLPPLSDKEIREMPNAQDIINHPSHYGGDNVYEAIKVIEAWNLGFNLGNAVKYVARHGKKAGHLPLDDLKKARWYLDREIANRESANPSAEGITFGVTGSMEGTDGA